MRLIFSRIPHQVRHIWIMTSANMPSPFVYMQLSTGDSLGRHLNWAGNHWLLWSRQFVLPLLLQLLQAMVKDKTGRVGDQGSWGACQSSSNFWASEVLDRHSYPTWRRLDVSILKCKCLFKAEVYVLFFLLCSTTGINTSNEVCFMSSCCCLFAA